MSSRSELRTIGVVEGCFAIIVSTLSLIEVKGLRLDFGNDANPRPRFTKRTASGRS